MSVLDTHRKLHFVGVGGAGMSALAELLLHEGWEIDGCDANPGPAAARLADLGVEVARGHSFEHLDPDAALVVSSAVPAGCDEVARARERGQPVVRRAELLGAVMGRGRGIAIAGTHGKSTTTTMVGAILEAAGLDPTVLVGGRIRGQGGNVRIGGGDWLVAEADEFDRSFLALDPAHAVVTNVEADHLDTYASLEALVQAFAAFAARVESGGAIVVGVESPEAAALPLPAGRRRIGFGFDVGAEMRGSGLTLDRLVTRFEMRLPDGGRIPIELALPGRHNALNALAAAGLAWALDVEPEAIRRGLGMVRGVERRFEIVHEDEGVLIVDDYAHHPSEVAATLASAREGWTDRRIVAVFQPHLFSRTRDFAVAFGAALAAADVVFVTDVYPAREAPIEGVTGELVSEAARRAGAGDVAFVPTAEVADEVAERLAAGDLVLTMGAGDVDRVARAVAERRRSAVAAGGSR